LKVTSHQYQIDPRKARLLTLFSLRHRHARDHNSLLDAIALAAGHLDPDTRNTLIAMLADELEAYEKN
jgi:hypothetical protein